MPWRVPGGKNGVLLTLPEAEGQRVRAAGIFTSFPWAGLCPSTDRAAATPSREGGGFVSERVWFPPGGVERVKDEGQVLKSGRMLKSPNSLSPPPASPASSLSPPPPSHHHHPPLSGILLPGDLPGGSTFTPKLLGCSIYLSPHPMSSSSVCSNSPFPPPPTPPSSCHPGVLHWCDTHLFLPPIYAWVDGASCWGGKRLKKKYIYKNK